MNATSPEIYSLARRLLADSEPEHAESSHEHADQVVRTCEKLRVPLTKFTGNAGFVSLLSRALVLAKRQVPELKGLRVAADGSLEGYQNISPDLALVRHGGEVLLAELLNLLVTLIGLSLTLSLVSEAWPDVKVLSSFQGYGTKEQP
jgi:hypothetical protein